MNQVISGVVINIFATGITSFISAKFLQVYQELNNSGIFPTWTIPGLTKIPFIGGILFESNLFTYAMFGLLFLVQFGLFFTRWGLRTRAVGEHPKAADTLGINVFRMRYANVLIGGMLAGLAGAYFTIESVPSFEPLLTNGRGFISLAAMIFGNWRPGGLLIGALLFSQLMNFGGFPRALQAFVTGFGVEPYVIIITICLLYIVLGTFFEELSMILLTVPIFFPLVVGLGFDPVWFGVLFLINMQVGLLSPPFGLLLFAMKGVAPPHITMGQIVQAVMPYLYFGIGVMLLVFLLPPLATWLPRLLGS